MTRPLNLHRMSRKGFLGTAALAAVSLAVPACSPGQGAAAPKSGGRLRAAFAGGGAREILDPHKVNLFVDAARAKAVHDKLADQGDDMRVVPRLAEEWESSDDLTSWRVKLRKAVFHDGAPVRAADVLYSYARIIDPKESFRAKTNLDPIDIGRSRAVDDTTIEFALKYPLSEFPNAMAAFGAYIVPEDTKDFASPVGSGPFSFTSFEPGRSFLAERFEDYWDEPALLEELQIIVSDEESARVNALLGGQVDYAHDLSATTARANADNPALTLVSSPNSNMMGFAMKVDRPPFDDPDVRRAMFLLCDREELVESVLSGEGQIGNDLFGKGFEYYADDIPQRTQDVDEARRLLRKAGVNKTITLSTADVAAGFTEAASVFADQMRAAGLKVAIDQGNADTYWTDTLDSSVLSTYRSGAMPIETHISQRLLSGSSTNVTHWKKKAFDELYAQLQSTADREQRAGLYRTMQKELHNAGGYLVWGFANWIVATSKAVHGVKKAPANTLDWARFDTVWMD